MAPATRCPVDLPSPVPCPLGKAFPPPLLVVTAFLVHLQTLRLGAQTQPHRARPRCGGRVRSRDLPQELFSSRRRHSLLRTEVPGKQRWGVRGRGAKRARQTGRLFPRAPLTQPRPWSSLGSGGGPAPRVAALSRPTDRVACWAQVICASLSRPCTCPHGGLTWRV